MTFTLSTNQRRTFYSASLIGLRALDQAEGVARRFGPDADARWKSFRGHLGTTERLDLLIRDAAVKWNSAFSPAVVFSLPGLATDEPFGPDWGSFPEHEAEGLWNDDSRPISLQTISETLGIEEKTIALPRISASTRLVVAGGAAITAVARYFQQHSHLSWSDQVLAVAEKPELRHLAGLMAVLLFAAGPTRLVLPDEDAPAVLKVADFPSGGTEVISDDASSRSLGFVRQAVLGG